MSTTMHTELCDECSSELEAGQIGLCDECQASKNAETPAGKLVHAAMTAYAKQCGYESYSPAEFHDDALARFIASEAHDHMGDVVGFARSMESMAQNLRDIASEVEDALTATDTAA